MEKQKSHFVTPKIYIINMSCLQQRPVEIRKEYKEQGI